MTKIQLLKSHNRSCYRTYNYTVVLLPIVIEIIHKKVNYFLNKNPSIILVVQVCVTMQNNSIINYPLNATKGPEKLMPVDSIIVVMIEFQRYCINFIAIK